jgi:hypothetical protein
VTQSVPRLSTFAGGGRTCLAAALLAPCLMAQTPGAANRAANPTSTQAAPPAYVPITQKQRAAYYVRHMFNIESVLRAATAAGINQGLNTPREWGQGGEGYGRRFASIYGEHIIQSTVMYGASAALDEDNRYFRSGESGFGRRAKYAVESTFLARHSDGSRHFSISRMSSYAAAAGLSRLWQPPTTRGAVHAADVFGIAVGVDAGFNVAREFFPRILHSRPPVAH